MTTDSHVYSTDDERTLLAIARRLSPERGRQLLAFARSLAFESSLMSDSVYLENDRGQIRESDTCWNQLLASEEGQAALDVLADEALAEIQAGRAMPIIVTDEDELSDQ